MFVFSTSMASTAINPPVSEMAELHSHGIGVPILFPIAADGIVVVLGLQLNIRFSLKVSTIWLERELFHLDTRLFVQTLHETSKLIDNGNVVWEIGARKYKVYGLLDSQMEVSNILYPIRCASCGPHVNS